MGQKTHPLGFRLGITQEHKSIWYANFNQYAKILKEDDKIRSHINTIAKINAISNVRINRNTSKDQVQLDIETGKPLKLVKNIQTLIANLKKILPPNRQLIIEVVEVELNASLLADLVTERLEKRIPFRQVIRYALQKAEHKLPFRYGIKIQISGRLNGAEMARSEWVRKARVPLQTLRADIDYAAKEAYTIYGILGIKIWLFKDIF